MQPLLSFLLLLGWGVQAAEITPAEAVPESRDHTVLWWANGWLDGAPRRPGWICLQTGYYGAVFDPQRAALLRLGPVPAAADYAALARADADALLQLPEALLELTVATSEGTFHCVRAATKTSDWLNFPVRIIESGRWLQRWDILQLEFETAEGRRLDAEGRLEVVAWPDELRLVLEVTPGRDLGEGSVSLSLKGQGVGRHPQVARRDALLKQAAPAVASLGVPLTRRAQPAPLLLAARRLIEGEETLAVTLDELRGWHRVELPPRSWAVAREPDRLERVALTLENPGPNPAVARLLFDAPDGTPGITGLTPMLRDREGFPTGIPVQISKNWHRREERRMLYEGPWLHAVACVRLPPRSRLPLEFNLCWARWGGVPAASHAQLCLVGWGWNQLWDQVAIGSWGESICYEPDAIQKRCRIDDIRPLMVWGMNGDRTQWTWTHNVGGGDFLVYENLRGEYQPWRGVRTAYLSQGPNLTDVLYSGTTADGHIACRVRVSTPRSDDLHRAYHTLRYDVLQPTPFARLAFYQLGSDEYHWHQYDRMARGNASGLVEEWPPGRGGRRYLRAAIPCVGDTPWFSLHAGVAQDHLRPVRGAWAVRGLVLRSWKARLGGTEAPPFAAVFGTEAGRIPSANLELVPPPGLTRLQPGDFVEAQVELLILPMSAGDYYGPNENLRASLCEGANTWRPVFRQATGNRLSIVVQQGKLTRAYPPAVTLDRRQSAALEITGGLGYVPLTFDGLRDYRDARLWKVTDAGRQVVDQSVHGRDFWQTEYDPRSRRWRITYNLPLDAPGDRRETVRLVFGR